MPCLPQEAAATPTYHLTSCFRARETSEAHSKICTEASHIQFLFKHSLYFQWEDCIMLADNNFPEMFLRTWLGNHGAGEKGPFKQPWPSSLLSVLQPGLAGLGWAGSSEVPHHTKPYCHLRGSQASIPLAFPLVGFNFIFWVFIVSLLCS